MTTRTREKDDRVLNPAEYEWNRQYLSCATDSTVYAAGYPFYEGEYRRMTDQVIPNFRERSARGEVFVNPMTSYFRSFRATPGTYAYRIPSTGNDPCDFTANSPDSWVGLYYKAGISDHLVIDIDVARLKTLAGTQAQANINSPTFAGWVALGELRETLGYLRNPLKSTTTIFKKAKRAKNRSPGGSLQTVAEYLSDNWLSWRYAFLPVMQDISNALDAIEELKKKPPERYTARGVSSESRQESSSITRFGRYTDGSKITIEQNTSRAVDVRAGVLYTLDLDPDTFGTAPSQLPITAWELLTLSFVLDWFLNVGTFIEAITPKAGVKILGQWTTTADYRITQTISWTSERPDPIILQSDGTINEFLVERTKTRVAGISVGLAFKPQPFLGNIGKKRIIDLFALASSILKSR